MEVKEWLVCYDYGMGGLWAVMKARNQAEITNKFPDLTVYAIRPKIFSDYEYNEIRSETLWDVNEPPQGWLKAQRQLGS